MVKWISRLASDHAFRVRVLARAHFIRHKQEIIMKKIFLILLVSVSILSFYANTVSAQALCDESFNGTDGLVPCGRTLNANGTVFCPCTFGHIGKLVLNIFNFIVNVVAVPLAGLIIVISGVLFMISGSSPNLYSKAKNMLWWTLIAILLILTSWLIIHTVLWALGVDPAFIG